ncbi:MAG: hypothetical protein ABI181_14340 [Mycobacteriaceae bacterium]
MFRRIAVLLCVLSVAACTRTPAADPPVIVPTVPLPPTTTVPTTTAAPTVTSSCAEVVPGDQLDLILGRPWSSVVSVIIGVPVPDIGRTGQITCRYGAPVQGAYPVEISLNSYTSAATATERLDVTVAAAERQGIGSRRLPAGGADGLYIPYPTGATVVAAAGIYSVAVTLGPRSVPDQGDVRSAKLAGVVLAQAGV